MSAGIVPMFPMPDLGFFGVIHGGMTSLASTQKYVYVFISVFLKLCRHLLKSLKSAVVQTSDTHK